MRVATFSLITLATTQAFSVTPVVNNRQAVVLSMSEAVSEAPVDEAAEQEEAAPAASPEPTFTPSGFSMSDVRNKIAKMEASNFEATLNELESFLLNEAGSTMYAKSLRRITQQAKAVGATVPTGYAKDAKATSKRREKQNAFIAVKEEERLAAEAEAREAAEAAAAEALAAAEATEAAAAAEDATEEVTEEATEETTE